MTVDERTSSRRSAGGHTDLARHVAIGSVIGAALIGPMAVISTLFALAIVAGVVIFVTVLTKPQFAAYIFLAITPLIVGFERGLAIPFLRPHEALAVLVGLALATRGLVGLARGETVTMRLTRVDVALSVLIAAGTILPLWWEIARAIRPSRDDVLHSLVLWKYLAIYLIFRASIRTLQHLRTCVWLVLAVNGVVAAIAITQALHLFGTDRLMATFYPPLGSSRAALSGRGTSTLGHSIAVGDVMAISLAIAIAMLLVRRRSFDPVWGFIALFALGGIASGQMSGVIALAVAVLAVGYATKRLARAYVIGVPMLAIAGVLLMPVINNRLAAASAAAGVPPSWTGRLDNLQTYIFPRVFSDFNYLLGVRPSPRLPAWESWREWIFIESGYVWFLWVGGIPLLIAFAYFSQVVIRTTLELSRGRANGAAIPAIATFAATWMFVVLTLFDAHLTLRGAADLLFPLLALALVAVPARFVTYEQEFRLDRRSGGEAHVAYSP